MALSIGMLAKLIGIDPADLSRVNPRGRVDVLASAVIEKVAGQLGEEHRRTYQAAKPLIDGLLVKHLGKFLIPEEALKHAGEIVSALPSAGHNGNGGMKL